jgi:hypothetical protein
MQLGMMNKNVPAINPALVNAGTATAVTIDTLGFQFSKIVLHIGATDVAATVLKIQESDTNNGSDWDDITGTSLSGTQLFAATDDNKIWAIWGIALSGSRMRYQRVVATVGGTTGTTGCLIEAQGVLSRGETTPWDATSEGSSVTVNIQ